MYSRHLLAFLAATFVAFAHDGHNHAQAGSNFAWGQSARLGGGSVRTYVITSKVKEQATGLRPPVEIGVEVPRAVLNSLPDDPQALVMDFPIQARNTPFQFMMFDWNPKGHEPAGVYDLPHFDFHFYMQDLDDVMAIRPGNCMGVDCDDFARATKPVPEEFRPQGYIDVGSVVPFMGNHLIDPTSPEFNGQRFISTWLYGAYDGQITFYEPMITRHTLINRPNHCESLKLPRAYSTTGYYPKTYCTSYNEETGMHRVYIKDFEYRIAPQSR